MSCRHILTHKVHFSWAGTSTIGKRTEELECSLCRKRISLGMEDNIFFIEVLKEGNINGSSGVC